MRAGFPIEQVSDLSVLVRPEHAEAAIRFFYARTGEQKTEAIHQNVMLLRNIAKKRTSKDDPVRELLDVFCKNFAVSVSGMRARNRYRLTQFDDADNVDALLSLPERIVAEVRRDDDGGYRAAMRIAYAVAIELLIVAPMRIKNLASLEHDRHLVRSRIGGDGVIHVCIPADEMKNHEPYEMELPKESARPAAALSARLPVPHDDGPMSLALPGIRQPAASSRGILQASLRIHFRADGDSDACASIPPLCGKALPGCSSG